MNPGKSSAILALGQPTLRRETSLRLAAGSCLLGLVLAAALGFGRAPIAAAVILPPTTIDGPSIESLSLAGVAMAPDGTGGLVYTKSIGGVPHVFVSRYADARWAPPIRVDWGEPYNASQPAIAAAAGGRLMVVWVTQVATLVSGEVRYGLYSASLGPGASEFGPALLVDPNVRNGAGVDPSLAGTTPGKAVVAYRVVTKIFGLPGELTDKAQLRPGDVLADTRVARLEGDRWSRLGPINRFPATSTRPPSETNGPKLAIGKSGRAVVAWQEPDRTGAARVWMRRITGTTVGPVLAASPETWEGKVISGDATAIGVAVSGLDRARVAVRVDGGAASALGGQRVFLTSLASSSSPDGGKPVGPELVDGGAPSGSVGPPAVAAADGAGAGGAMRLVFTSGAGLKVLGVDRGGKVSPAQSPANPGAQAETAAVAAVDVEGGGTVAYQATDAAGSPAVAVRQEFPDARAQTGLLYGPLGGPISQLVGDGTEGGDALVAFRQGEGGRFAIVADRIASPPARFPVRVPDHWVRPGKAEVRWGPAPSGVGGITYGLILNGRVVKSGLTRRRILPPRAVLGNGVDRVQVKATDRDGNEVLSSPVKLRVDAQPPHLRVRVRPRQREVALRLADRQSGLRAGSIRVDFGDGSRQRGHARLHHGYASPGRFTVLVRARDRVGNRLFQRVGVTVP